MTHPLPTRLPGLIRSALEHGWDVDIHRRYHRGVWAVVAWFGRDDAEVCLAWDIENGPTPRLIDRTVDHTPTPYTQCVALLKTMED